MEQTPTRGELLSRLVSRGAITQQEADEVRRAPEWSVGIKELVTYLASIIIGVGVIRTVAVALEDASQASIAAILYVVAVILGILSWKLAGRTAILARFSEVCELGALLSLGLASGLLLSDTDLSAQSYISVMGAVALAWGVWRAPHSRFAGVLEASVGVPMFSAGLGAWIVEENPSVAGFLLLVTASGLVALGWTNVGSAFLARSFGSIQVFIAATMLAEHYQGVFRLLPVAAGAVLFAVGAVQLAPEMLLVGALSVVVGVVATVMNWVDNEIAQGIIIVATGVVMLLVLGWQMRRTVSARSTGAPAA